MKKIFLLLGMSGSGKTTISKELVLRNTNIEHYSIGNKFREIAKNDNELAKYVFSGKRVPSKISKKVITSIVENFEKDIILIDGYPRDTEQMKFFTKLIECNRNPHSETINRI
jgi:adenylate kinase family enzyme